MNRRPSRRAASGVALTSASSASSSSPVGARRRLDVAVAEFRVADETARTRLIGDICCLLREPAIPESARSAGLELIGWLARRMPGESAHALGVEEAREAQRSRKPR